MKGWLTSLVGLFPPDFRRAFGAEIEEQVGRDYDRARGRSVLAALVFTWTTAWDLVRSAMAERIEPTRFETAMRAGANRETEAMTRKGDGMIRETREDLGHAIRSLARTPTFTATAVGTLAVSMGALAAVFAVVDRVLLAPLPFSEPDRLVAISASAPGSELSGEFGVSTEFVVQYGEAELLEDLSTYNSFTATFRAGERGERIRMAAASAAFFRMMGVEPALGRLPTEDDEDTGLVLSHALWADWFGSDPEILGRSFAIFGPPRTVIGVMGPDFDLPDFASPGQRVMLWLPDRLGVDDITPGNFGHDLIAKMVDGADIESVTSELNRLAARLPERFGGTASYARIIERHEAVVRPLQEQILGSASRSIWILFGSLAVVLLIACANVTNLFLARTEQRRRDIAVRRAMGAGRFRLVRAQFAEVAVVSLLGAGLAFVIAWVGLPALVAAAPSDVHRLSGVGVTGSTMGFLMMAALAATVACGLIPALGSARVGFGALRDGIRGSTRGASMARDLLVVGQTALALMLLAGSGLLLKSVQELRAVDPGYDVEDVFTFQTAPESDGLVDGPSWTAFHHELMDRIRSLPGVESVGIVENVPLNEGVGDLWFLTEDAVAEGSDGVPLGFTAAGGDYFQTMGMEVVRGRSYRRADHLTDLGNLVVSRGAAQLFWPGEDPIGKRLRLRGFDTWETVVGVVEDVMQGSLREAVQPVVYLPMQGQSPGAWALSSPGYVVKTERAEEIGGEIRALIEEMAPGAPVYRTFTMEQLAADSMRRLTFTMVVVAIAAGLALLLGTVGLYGVLSYVVAQRTREIGVRMALGAEASGVRRMVVAEGSRVVGVGLVVGVVGGLAASRLLGSFLYNVDAADPSVFAGVAALMLLVGIIASYIPARRASSVDPVQSLRAG